MWTKRWSYFETHFCDFDEKEVTSFSKNVPNATRCQGNTINKIKVTGSSSYLAIN